MSESVVERMARALYEQDCRNHGVEPDWGRGGFKTSIGAWMACARAAIAALREPTPEMVSDIEAAVFEYTAEPRDWTLDAAKDGWQAGIDAALKENADG